MTTPVLAIDYWEITSAFAGALAAVVAVIAILITIKYARDAGSETQTLIGSLRSLTRETEAQGRVQEALLSEQRASRTIDLLRDVARQLAEVRISAERFQSGYLLWSIVSSDQYRLQALLSVLTDDRLSVCERVVTSASADEILTLLPEAQREVGAALKRAAGVLTIAIQATISAASSVSADPTVERPLSPETAP